MSFTEWFFGGIDNPRVENQWGPLHIATLVVCVGLILAFYFIVKQSKAPQKVRTGIVCTLAGDYQYRLADDDKARCWNYKWHRQCRERR